MILPNPTSIIHPVKCKSNISAPTFPWIICEQFVIHIIQASGTVQVQAPNSVEASEDEHSWGESCQPVPLNLNGLYFLLYLCGAHSSVISSLKVIYARTGRRLKENGILKRFQSTLTYESAMKWSENCRITHWIYQIPVTVLYSCIFVTCYAVHIVSFFLPNQIRPPHVPELADSAVACCILLKPTKGIWEKNKNLSSTGRFQRSDLPSEETAKRLQCARRQVEPPFCLHQLLTSRWSLTPLWTFFELPWQLLWYETLSLPPSRTFVMLHKAARFW